jgi:hypothetical protein
MCVSQSFKPSGSTGTVRPCYESFKIFMPAGAKKPVYAPYIEHVPPDVTACIFWLKNRDPAHWRDAWQIEASVGKYIISEKPMSEEEWIRERATMIDVTPEQTNNIGEQGRVRLPAADARADRKDEAPARRRSSVRPGARGRAAGRPRQDLGDQEPPDDGDVG